jgi:hypothetical protein
MAHFQILLYTSSRLNPTEDTRVQLLTDGPTSATAVSIPDPPSGFFVSWHFQPNKPLSILAIYLSAIDCMYQYAQKGWDDIFEGGARTWVTGYKVEVDLEDIQKPGGPLPLLISHIVLGLYYTIVELWRSKRYCKVTASLSTHNRQRGTLRIQDLGSPVLSVNTANDNLTNISPGALSFTTPTYPSGSFSDVDDHRFTIDYAYDGGRIASEDIFIAALDGLATSAQYIDDSKFQHLAATSASGKCQIDVSEVASPHQVNYSYVIKALRILTLDVIRYLRKFEGMTFDLKWEGISIAKGYMKAVQRVDNDGSRGIDIARREARALPRLLQSQVSGVERR